MIFLDVPNCYKPCPFDLDEVKQIYGPDVTCGEGGGYVPANPDDASPSASVSAATPQYSTPSRSDKGGPSAIAGLAALACTRPRAGSTSTPES